MSGLFMDHPEWTPEQRHAVELVHILRLRRDVILSQQAEIQHMARSVRDVLNSLDPPATPAGVIPLYRTYQVGGSTLLPAAVEASPSRHPAPAVAGNPFPTAEPSA